MKNEKIIQSYDAHAPDNAAKARMLESALAKAAAAGTPLRLVKLRRVATIAVGTAAAVAVVVAGVYFMPERGTDVVLLTDTAPPDVSDTVNGMYENSHDASEPILPPDGLEPFVPQEPTAPPDAVVPPDSPVTNAPTAPTSPHEYPASPTATAPNTPSVPNAPNPPDVTSPNGTTAVNPSTSPPTSPTDGRPATTPTKAPSKKRPTATKAPPNTDKVYNAPSSPKPATSPPTSPSYEPTPTPSYEPTSPPASSNTVPPQDNYPNHPLFTGNTEDEDGLDGVPSFEKRECASNCNAFRTTTSSVAPPDSGWALGERASCVVCSVEDFLCPDCNRCYFCGLATP
ncbi:MAG: hypothetical protein FWG45_01805 [Oscillospiraceae bacterium]|nr:hypothetical protein [Oscillospiraceae bacterium]